MSWTLAPALVTLRRQVDAAFPARSKASDGTIGDTAHSARRSDHNPDGHGVVRAVDITHDPDGGVDCRLLAGQLAASGDERIKYVIWDRRIWSPGRADEGWRGYHGANGHTHHLHLSVTGSNDGRPWNLPMLVGTPPLYVPPAPAIPAPTPSEEEDTMTWLISDGLQVWLTNGIERRAVTLPTDDLGTIADKLRQVVFLGWARNAVKADGVPEVATNAQILASIPVR